MSIPVHNLYYLLTYAWDLYEPGQRVRTNAIETTELIDLFAGVLIEGTRTLLRRGLDRNYRTYSRELAGVRGQVDFGASINRMLFQQGRAQCRVDEFTHDIRHNRLLKATLRKVASNRAVASERRRSCTRLVARFDDVTDISLRPELFSQVRLHRNNQFYRLLMRVCELIARRQLVNEDTGESEFRDIVRDQLTMSTVFEKFVLNFYSRELDEFEARSHRIRWNAEAHSDDAASFLPTMLTDVTLSRDDRVLIIDTKYYVKALTSHHESASVRSGHLYQMFAYLKNYAAEHPERPMPEGMLLYPVVDSHLRLSYDVFGHPLRVCTVNLAAPWQEIHDELIGLAS
ncbi:MAG: 5-methylcytosine-specific restriction endonuclease system specificity protein McrC [Myxococcota bacterium]